MRISSLVHLYRVRLRSRLVQELLAVAGIAVGVALMFAALVANTSLTSSMRELTDGIVGKASLQLGSRSVDGFDQALVKRVTEVDGVQTAAPIVETRVNVDGPRGKRSVMLIGADARFAELGGELVRPFAATQSAAADTASQQRVIALPAPIATDIGLGFGAPIKVENRWRTVESPGVPLQRADIGTLVDSPIALAPLAYVQEIAELQGRVTRVFVEPERGREQDVEAALRGVAGDRLNVRAADADVEVFERAAYPTKQSTALFSGLSALVGFLFAFSAVLLTVPQRRRLIADLRMAGHEPWTLVQMLLFDALMLGLAGSLLGLVGGSLIASHLFDDVPDYLAFTFSISPQETVTWQSIAIAGSAGILAACVAVLAPLRDVLSRHPLASRSTQADPPLQNRLAIAGAVCLAVTTLVIVVAPDLAMVGLVTLTIALLLLLPWLLRLATAAFQALTRNMSTPVPILAILELRSASAQVRTLAVAATGALAVFATVSVAGARGDLQRGLDESTRATVGNSDVWVTFPDSPNVLPTTAFRASRIRESVMNWMPSTRSSRLYGGALLDVGDHRAWVLGPPADSRQPVPTSQIREGDADLATKRIRAGGWVVLSEAIADELNVDVGARVRLPTPAPVSMRVAAISSNLGWPPGAILLNFNDFTRAWGTLSATASAFNVDAEPRISPDRVKRDIETNYQLRGGVSLQVETSDQRTQRHYDASRDGLTRLTQISALVLIAAVLATAAAMVGMIWQRRPTIAALKVHGYPELELWRALLLESGLLLGTGCLVGAAFGLFGQLLLSRALETITGFPILYSAAGPAAVGILALVTAVAVAMLAIPGWLAVRVRPAPGTSS